MEATILRISVSLCVSVCGLGNSFFCCCYHLPAKTFATSPHIPLVLLGRRFLFIFGEGLSSHHEIKIFICVCLSFHRGDPLFKYWCSPVRGFLICGVLEAWVYYVSLKNHVKTTTESKKNGNVWIQPLFQHKKFPQKSQSRTENHFTSARLGG